MNQTLLLADASATIQRIVELTFAAENIAVVPFSNGEHAIASLDRNVPDIVLADVGMPGRSGYEISRYIKNSPPLAHIPVLLLTGAFEPVDQTKALEAGCDGILIKPFEPQFVINRVKELLRKPKPGTKEAEVEEYFEELDKAFANLSASAPPAVLMEPHVESTLAAGVDLSIAHDEPLSHGSIEPELSAAFPMIAVPESAGPVAPDLVHVAPIAAELPRVAPIAAELPKVAPVVAMPPAPPAATPASAAPRPSLAEAFTALLAAERSGNGTAALQPALVPSARPIPVDDIVEQVTRRVIEQMTDSVVRETVSNIVSATAERLVREEIERIKSNIK
jgi:CheY-like chemotaxis protein